MDRRLALSALAFLPVFAHAQFGQNVTESFLGPEVGVFLPADRTLRDGVAERWTRFGVGSVSLSQFVQKKSNVSLDAISGSGNGSKVAIYTYSMGIAQPLGNPRKDSSLPYFALRAGVSYMDYAVNTSATTRESAKRIGFNGNAELGIILNGRISLSARYDVFPQYDGLRFDGLTLSLKYGISGY
jgi:hypothetical protein